MTHARRALALAALCAAVMPTIGCGRAVVTTDIKPDGTWVRRLEFHGPAPNNGKPNEVQLQPAQTVEDVFGVPKGAGWTVVRKRQKSDNEGMMGGGDEMVITAERTFKAGETSSPGALLKDDKGAPLLTDTVTVTPAGPGRWKYSETLHWVGKRDLGAFDTSEFRTVLRGALPADLKSVPAAELAPLERRLTVALARILFGPNTPLLSQLLMNPDLGQRELARRGGPAIDRALGETFGARLTADARRDTVRRLIAAMETEFNSSKSKMNGPQAGEKADKGGAGELSPLTFTVKLPGKVVETNGERDEYGGVVYWSMYGLSPAVEDVTMTAVCQTGA